MIYNMSKKIIKYVDNYLLVEENEDVIRYINNKITELSKNSNYTDKQYHLNLFQEILNMCDEDINTADFSDVTTKAPYFNLNKENYIVTYNIIYILGSIYLNVFNRNNNQLKSISEGINGPISTKDMFLTGYQELESKSKLVSPQNSICAYGATLIFATIFEHNLKSKIKQIEVQKLLDLLKSAKDTRNIILDDNDEKLYNYLYNEYFGGTTILGFDGVQATTEELFTLLTKYSIVNPNDINTIKLIKNKFTLGAMLNSTMFDSISDDRFTKLCKLIFSTKKMNLRNNLAHCNFGYINYYHINVTVLLYILCFIVTKELFIK